MNGIRVVTVSAVQLDPSSSASLRLTAAIEGEPDRIIQISNERAVVPWGEDLREWVKNALLAMVDSL